MTKSKARNDAEANKRPLRYKSHRELATVATAKGKNRQLSRVMGEQRNREQKAKAEAF